MPLAGHLRDLALMDLIQITCQERRQAQLVIQHEGQEVEIYFDAGEMVHAQLDDLVGEEVIYRVLGWEDGQFNLKSGVVPPTRTIETPWSVLLMSALQQHDEESWNTTNSASQEVSEMASKQASLQDLLAELGQEVQGFIAAAVVGMDGLAIAQHTVNPAVDMENISAQMTMLIKLAQTSVTKLKAGEIEADLLTTDKAVIQLYFLEDAGYFLGVAADRSTANLGNLRLYSRIYAEQLSKALPH